MEFELLATLLGRSWTISNGALDTSNLCAKFYGTYISEILINLSKIISEKFGLFNVNFTSPDLPRTAKASARYFAQIIRDNGFRTDQPCNNYPIS